ncbi:hypothetical protein HON52_02265 [Candidatus Uhrbacteria bacterium]|jgi:hypothetical protein|nr:hypothetical protein [Candidatus Uhrbacteria bacterium]
MTLTTHTAIGAAIGSSVGNPIIGFLLGFASHFLVDMIPHGDSKMSDSFRLLHKKGPVAYASIDGAIALYLVLTLSNIIPSAQLFAFSLAVAGSVLPDLLIGLQDLTHWRILKPFFRFHFFFHDFFTKKYGDVKLTYALAGQAAVIIFILLPLVNG